MKGGVRKRGKTWSYYFDLGKITVSNSDWTSAYGTATYVWYVDGQKVNGNSSDSYTTTKKDVGKSIYVDVYSSSPDIDGRIESNSITVGKRTLTLAIGNTSTFKYNGKEQGPTAADITISDTAGTINSGYYDLYTPDSSVEIGTYTISAEPNNRFTDADGQTGCDLYETTKLENTYTITANDDAFTAGNFKATVEECTYNGKEQTPKVSASIDGKELVEGTDYEVNYKYTSSRFVADNVNVDTSSTRNKNKQ